MANKPDHRIIDEYLARYEREIDFYSEAARLAESQCIQLLREHGIRAIVTSRAKDPTRLRHKLLQREPELGYESAEHITADIADLAGARIALYFPGDHDRTDALITETFKIETIKVYPAKSNENSTNTETRNSYTPRFDGYCAHHYRIHLKPESLQSDQHRFLQARIELQVASVLMHAWSEVEHDLAYKPQSGTLSHEELAILDEINGMVIAGEIALSRLQRAVEARVSRQQDSRFKNHYELASYLYEKGRAEVGDGVEPNVGRVDVLFEFLRRLGKNQPADIDKYLAGVNSSG